MQYRNFIIEPEFNYTNGTFDGKYYHKEADEAKMIIGQTLTEVKREIDDYISEGLEYRVFRKHPLGQTITKFWFLSDAVLFASQVGGDLKMYLNGYEVEFDAI